MSMSIRVTMTRPNIDAVWPFDIYPWSDIVATNFFEIEGNSVESWINGNEDTDLTIVVDHYFATNELFDSYRAVAYEHIPLWRDGATGAESDQYSADNNITVTITEVSDPNLSTFTRIDSSRNANIRTYTALTKLLAT
jgi:hypothetical protein